MISLSLLVACSSPPYDAVAIDAPHSSGSDAHDAPIDAPVAVACAGRTAQPLDATWTIMVGGLSRTAHVHVPASYDPGKRTPIVINLHGMTHTATQQMTLSHVIAKSDAAGFVVAHPEGTGSPTSWNAGGCCNPAAQNNVDDVLFINKLIDELDAKLCMDPDRVFAMGLSNGAHMAHRLACDLSTRIAAIGPVAGLVYVTTCPATRAVPVFDIHGSADPIVSYSYVPATIDFWKNHDHCTTTTTTYQHGDATCVTHGGCTAGAEVVLCTIDQGGHQWPGGDALPFLGKKSDDLISTDAIWNFFVAHPMQH